MKELNEDDGDFIHRRLKDYLIRNPEVNESNPLTPKIVSSNLTQKTPKSQSSKGNLAQKTPKAPAAMKTKSESPVVNSEYQTP